MPKFTDDQWERVNALLESEPGLFGLPERRDDSVILASFNIRKLGRRTGRSEQSWDFLARFCRQCDLLAVQEVQDNLEGFNHLSTILGDDFGLASSDITGGVPGGRGMTERLGFLYRKTAVTRTEVASDITFDRSAVLESLFSARTDFWNAFDSRAADLDAWESRYREKIDAWTAAGKQGRKPPRPGKPPFVLPHFLTFVRTPLCVSFRIPAAPGQVPYEFLAVNAHLLYGNKQKQKEEREMEFWALMKWLLTRAKQADRLYHKNVILFGDLNLDFEETDSRRDDIEETIKLFNKKYLRSRRAANVNFPFLDSHPGRGSVFRTNARKNQTYDQIALFAHDRQFPDHRRNAAAGQSPGGFDYGLFDFVELFSRAIYSRGLAELIESRRKTLFRKFEHDVSDHMPIWIRLPRTGPPS